MIWVGIILLALVVLGVVWFFAPIIWFRKNKPLSRKMAAQKKHLDEKSGVIRPTPAATTTEPGGEYRFSFVLGYVWGWVPWILLLAVLAVILWILLTGGVPTPVESKVPPKVPSSWAQDMKNWLPTTLESPGADSVLAWIRNYWLLVLGIAVVVYVFAAQLRTAVLWVTSIVLLLALLANWQPGWFGGTASRSVTVASNPASAQCPDYSPDKTNRCQINDKEWTTIPAYRVLRAGEFQFCYTYSGVPVEWQKTNDVMKFRAQRGTGEELITYRLLPGTEYPRGSDCPRQL